MPNKTARRGAARTIAAITVPALLAVGLVACDKVHDPQAVAASAHTTASKVGEDDYYRVTMHITNNSDLTLHLTSSSLGHSDGSDGGHWDQRPTDLAPKADETVSAYSAVQGQSITVNFVGVQSRLSIRLVAQDPWSGSNNTNGTKVQAPISVNASITSGRHATATFKIAGNY